MPKAAQHGPPNGPPHWPPSVPPHWPPNTPPLVDLAAPLGIYVSLPFCRAKCTFCNFSSDVGSAPALERYVDTLCREIGSARKLAAQRGWSLPERVDTVYFGGGTPSLLQPEQLRRLFDALRANFLIDADAEVTMEAAPGQIEAKLLDEAQRQGVDRVSLGVQSFVDREAAAVGRLHTGGQALAEVARLRREGVAEVGIDLIAGLPHQTLESWRESLEVAAASEATHLSVYMLEIDEDSRLGREVLAGGRRFHARAVGSEEATADAYEISCAWLPAHGFAQYEISNFARVPAEAGVRTEARPPAEGGERSAHESRHNRKYWERAPYLGLGQDAHSMLRRCSDGAAVRFANSAEPYEYELGVLGLGVLGAQPAVIGEREAFEETVFLGLRLTHGLDLARLRAEWPREWVAELLRAAGELARDELMTVHPKQLALSLRGRLLSNEVFGRLLEAVPA